MIDRPLSPAHRLAQLLDEVRQAKPDAREFALFERRDALTALGLPLEVIDQYDATNDAALDADIAHLCGDDDVTEVGMIPLPWASSGHRMLRGVEDAFGKAAETVAKRLPSLPRRAPVAYDKLPGQITLDLPKDKIEEAVQRTAQPDGGEVASRVVRKLGGSLDMVDQQEGSAESAKIRGMHKWDAEGLHHTHKRRPDGIPAQAVSGADLHALSKGTNYVIAQDGTKQSMFVATDRTNFGNRTGEQLRDQLAACADVYFYGGKSREDANKLAGRDMATYYGVGYYTGENNRFTREPPSLGQCAPLLRRGPPLK